MNRLRIRGFLFLLTALFLINSCGGGGSDNPAPVATTSTSFAGKLNGTQENPAVATGATGTGSFKLNAAKTELTFDITIDGLTGPMTAAHFHSGATGVNGGVVRTLTTNFTGNTATGTWTTTDGEPLTPALVTALEASGLYVNVHTAANPTGEIRGQVLPNQ
jgi:hypothetical protein